MTTNFQPPQKITKLIESEGPFKGRATPFFWRWLVDLVNIFAAQINPQAKNTVYAGPNTGANALPTFRSLTTNDMPGLAGTVTITTAKLTVAGANGSMTFVNGILTAQTQAT